MNSKEKRKNGKAWKFDGAKFVKALSKVSGLFVMGSVALFLCYMTLYVIVLMAQESLAFATMTTLILLALAVWTVTSEAGQEIGRELLASLRSDNDDNDGWS